MEIYIDNKNIETEWGIQALDWRGALGYGNHRADDRVWPDKSGVDVNIENVRMDSLDFNMQFMCKSSSLSDAQSKMDAMVAYIHSKGVFVLSLRDNAKSIRKALLCKRNAVLAPTISLAEQESKYVFRLALKDVNPQAVKYYTTISGNASTIAYTKGQDAVIYWGDGDRGEVSNSGSYTKNDYSADGDVDIVIDVDGTDDDIAALDAEFSASLLTIPKGDPVTFTDSSTGGPVLWSWDFGDGNGSTEQNPTHTYENEGTYTVKLTIFNSGNGSDIEEKINYVTVRASTLKWNDTDDFIINDSGDKLLNN